MQRVETVLGVLRERGRRGLPCDELYRQLFNPQWCLLAYGRIYANHGAMTPGVTKETVDGMSQRKIGRIIDAMRHERYRFRPVRRVNIPKKNGTTRPLGLPTWSDKLVGEVIRLLLEAYYEPAFSDRSHGFRPKKGCHTALREVAHTWTGTAWFVEGDIADCFGSLDHQILLSILGEKIRDSRFLRLVRNMLTAGYLEDWRWGGATLSGAPQGGVASPVLSNIYLHKLDEFVEKTTQQNCSKVTRGRRSVNGQIALRVPLDVIKAKSFPYLARGKPAKQPALMNSGDHAIVATFGAIYRGIVQYCLLAGDVHRLHRLRWVMETSMLKTLAGEHRSTVSKVAAKYKATVETPNGPRIAFVARIERKNRKPLVARFGGIPLQRQRTAEISDRQPVRVDYPQKELISRLLADTCEICGSKGNVQVHHIRALADLAHAGWQTSDWARVMLNRRRETVVACDTCHDRIHSERPVKPLTP
ncbi:reverse transcriptase domain-containing protein [Streptomyces sp. enrichment culture]|uniref:reverse transcriptase/maturase family protein n=1 Tax=Streptomyces sp. enrichment culture TaxID=1795815 RepID=UPI003F54AE90